MGNQMLYDLSVFGMLLYFALCLSITGRPSVASALLRRIRGIRPSFSSSKVASTSKLRGGWLRRASTNAANQGRERHAVSTRHHPY